MCVGCIQERNDESSKQYDRLIVEFNGKTDAPEVIKAQKEQQLWMDIHVLGRPNTPNGKAGESHLRMLYQVGEASSLQTYFWQNYLALMNQTQMVERGVKDAANVGKTFRSEPYRSALGVIRSLLVHNDRLTNKTPAQKTQVWAEAATELYIEHQDMINEEGYKEWLEETIQYISGEDHFSKHLEEERLQAVEERGRVQNKELAAQKTKGVDRTGESMNLIKYKKVLKGTPATGHGHQEALRMELIFRGEDHKEVNDLITNGMWWSDVIGRLMTLEIERVREEPGCSEADIDVARKYFKPLSEANFGDLTPIKHTGTKRKAVLKPLEVEQPKKKKGSGRNRY